jgi:uncharacterized protein (TIGR03000 family)
MAALMIAAVFLVSTRAALGQPGSQATGEPTVENPAYGSQYSGPGGGQERASQGPAAGDPFAPNQAGSAATVVCPGGCHGGFHPFTCRAYAGPGYYGFFRRYYGYPFYGPTYRSGPMNLDRGYGLVNGVVYHAGVSGYGAAPVVMSASTPAAAAAPTANPARPANTAYLQLIVPQNAEVRVEGSATSRKGAVREFISPPLDPDRNFVYTIAVRGTDAGGKPIEEQRSIRVHANDQLRIDFTQPASAQQVSSSAPLGR